MSLQTLISGFVRYQNNSQEKGSFLVSKSRLTSFSTGVERFGHDLAWDPTVLYLLFVNIKCNN